MKLKKILQLNHQIGFNFENVYEAVLYCLNLFDNELIINDDKTFYESIRRKNSNNVIK